MGIILANVVVMAMPYYDASDNYELGLTVLNWVFTWIFIIEAITKIGAMRFAPYLKDNWNKLDLFIILTSIPDLLASVGAIPNTGGVTTVFRIFRIGRMFKLIRKAKGLRMLFNTLIASLPAIFNVGSLLFLLMFVYAVLGMNLFGGPGNPFEGQPAPNFSNFGASLVALFQTFTGDGWSGIMAQASGCDSYGYNCNNGGQSLVACLFFCT